MNIQSLYSFSPEDSYTLFVPYEYLLAKMTQKVIHFHIVCTGTNENVSFWARRRQIKYTLNNQTAAHEELSDQGILYLHKKTQVIIKAEYYEYTS